MRVLFVTNAWPDPRAPWRGPFIKSQAQSLRRLGVEIDVLSIAGYESRRAYLRAARVVAALNMADAYDVVHAHYGHSGVIARLQLRAPLVISFLGDDVLGCGGRQTRISARVFRQLPRLAAATITKSAEMESYLPASTRDRNTVIPNGVDLDLFRPRSRLDARARLGWPQEERVLLFVAAPSRYKNYPVAQAVLELVQKQVDSAVLRVAESVPHDEMPHWFNAADVLLLPSRSEGSPNAVKEAMASALPVVASPVGDVPELLGQVEGCFVRPAEPSAMAEAVLKALQFESAPAARSAIRPLALDAVARRILEVYRSVAGAHRTLRPSRSMRLLGGEIAPLDD